MTNLQKIESIITNREPLEEHNIDFIFHAIYDYIIDSGYDKKNIKIAKDYLINNRDFIKSSFGIKNNFDKKRTFVCYCRFWGFGGCERVLSILLPYLAKSYNVILITTKEEGFILPSEVEHLKIDISNEDKVTETLVSLCLTFSTDIFMPLQNFIDSILKYYDIMKQLDIKTIAYNHEHYFNIFELSCFDMEINRSILVRNERLKNATVVTWLLNYFDNIYSINNDNSMVMPNPLVFDIKKEKHEYSNNIIAVSRWQHAIKRLDLAIEVFSKILKLKEDIELYLVGPYNQEQLDSLLKQYEIPTKNIHVIGLVEDIKPFYEKCSLLMMTSESEGFPMVLLEAGAYGIPSVVLEINGLEDLVIDGQNGFIVDRNNLDEMSKKIINIIQDKKLYDYMSLKSLEISKKFTKEKFFKRWDNLLDCIFTYSNQYDLNVALKERFPKNHFDKDIFIKNIVKQYESNYANSALYNQKQIKDRDEIINELDNAIKYRDGIIQDFDNAVKEREKILKDWDITIKDRNKIINNLNNTVKDRDTAIENLHNQNNIQDQVIKQLKNSWSYRIGRFCTYFLSIPWEFCKFIRDYNLIKKSKLFDSEYYLAQNEDVKRAKIDPIKHYLKFGWKEGRNPSINFDGNEYLNKRPDVKVAGICPLVHYLLFVKE